MIVQRVFYKDYHPQGTFSETYVEVVLTSENIAEYYGDKIIGPDVILDETNQTEYVDTTQSISKMYQSDTFAIPVVRERWFWTLDPVTNFAIKRDIHIEWYRGLDDLTDPDNPVPVILPPTKHYDKFYPDTVSKVTEIQRRRKNVITKLEEDVITFIAMTETAGQVGPAIVMGQSFMTEVSSMIVDFIEHGDDDLAALVEDPATIASHPFLSNDLGIVGLPGVTIAQFIALELTIDISDALDTDFTFDDYPTY